MTSYDARPLSRPPRRSLYAAIASFPIVCIVLAFVTDLAYLATASYLWETMSVWLLTIALVGAALAVAGGLVDLLRSRRGRVLGVPWVVVLGQVVALGLSVVNVLVHSRDGYTAVVPQGLILSFLAVSILGVTAVWGRATAAGARVGGLA